MAGERLTFGLRPLAVHDERPRILVHGVSVGEIKASQSLVHTLAEDAEVVLSASTDTGIQVARQIYPDARVVRFPLDHIALVRRFLRRVRPDCIVLMELEIWPNFLRAANDLGIPVAIVSGRITEKSYRNYRRFRETLFPFDRFALVAAQDDGYAARFAELAGSRDNI
jgi:3-deoxy-D-manno-octulosonic-acid transferase